MADSKMAQSWNKFPSTLRQKIVSAYNSKKIKYSKDTLCQLEDLHIMLKKVRKSLKADEKASRLGKSPNKATRVTRVTDSMEYEVRTYSTEVRFGSTVTQVFSYVGEDGKKCSYGRAVIQMDKWVYRDTSKNKEEKDINMYLGASAVSPPPSPRSPIKLRDLEEEHLEDTDETEDEDTADEDGSSPVLEWDYNLETDIYEFEERAETEINDFDDAETLVMGPPPTVDPNMAARVYPPVHVPRKDPSASDSDGP